ncbi:hypothetical protein RDABS01_009061 [Bienertia sinuspersici]
MKAIVSILKDNLSIIKATLLLSSKPTTSLHVAVLRATTHRHQEDPPPVDAVLALAHHHRPSTAGVLIHALLRRVHGTHNVYVALKCLVTIHHAITRGSPALKDHILGYSSGPLFNLSGFIDGSDRDTWELSKWVRWYADVLDYGLALSRRNENRAAKKLSCFVVMIEKICGAPDSLHYQKISLIHEIIKLVGEDYRIIMREINSNLNQFQFAEKSIEKLNHEVLQELLDNLKRIEDCKQKLLLMFLNKKKNDGIWELIEELRKKVEEVKQKKEENSSQSRSLVIVPPPRVKRWLDVEWNPLVASLA